MREFQDAVHVTTFPSPSKPKTPSHVTAFPLPAKLKLPLHVTASSSPPNPNPSRRALNSVWTRKTNYWGRVGFISWRCTPRLSENIHNESRHNENTYNQNRAPGAVCAVGNLLALRAEAN